MILLDPSRRLVIGHRGARAVMPENTLQSLQHAVALGVDALEFDLHLAKDGVPVVHHDATLDRCTDATGPVRDRTSLELGRVSASHRFTLDGGRSFPFREQRFAVPTLWEVLEAIRDIPLILEMKSVEVAAPALRVLQETGNLHRVLIGSFLDAALIPFREAGVPVSPGADTLKARYAAAVLGARPASLPFQALCIPRFHYVIPLPVTGFARMMRSAGGPTHVWTINDPARATQLWRDGINGIISDDPALMLRTRETLQ
ncbi:glycerophosphodiester phosphodiesterase family protein [Pseudogemmatithrix spongiicola]|uniref:Glycerophosphodiester phosphodiesterase family protein n=1 Tax=Pseudogemmatithrix spongiicola TaxID=3062599 RepID=A0AA49Q7S9_9BACT|nr:glycerophosphodiester phosphodiesterase family protein [Gemmatimonadaceae bacterium 'strain 138']WKW16033.1 glycerophosphodiester phosphodiesterase family protein [Gemmatimonadaceae bacterium 'strain 318']